jgi:hypothetical protein
VRAQFFEQDGAEHHVAVLATLAVLDVKEPCVGCPRR